MSNPFLSRPDDVEVVEDPRLTARRARLRRVFYAIVGPAAVGTVVLAVTHVAKRAHAVTPAVMREPAVASAAPAVPTVAPELAVAAPPSSVSAAAEPSAALEAAASAAPVHAVKAPRPSSGAAKQKRAWAWKTGTR